MTSTGDAINAISGKEPSLDELYAPSGSSRGSHETAAVWEIMRLCISKPGTIWCTICKTWYKYQKESMPSLVHHCKRFHSKKNSKQGVEKTKMRSAVHSTGPIVATACAAPSAPPTQRPQLPAPVAPVARSGGVASARVPVGAFASPLPHASFQPPLPRPVPGVMGSPEHSATPKNPRIKLPIAKKGIAKRCRERLAKVVAAPEAVRRIAENCQKILFESTGMTFVNVKFQVPRSKEEALSVINAGIRDMEKSTDSRKLYFLGWAHSQIFSAEMAALGYRFLTAGIRCDTKMTKPPPLESWLTLERPLGGSLRRKIRITKPSNLPSLRASAAAPASLNPFAQTSTGTPALGQPRPRLPITPQTRAPTSPQSKRAGPPAAGGHGAKVSAPGSARRMAGRIIDTIDLT